MKRIKIFGAALIMFMAQADYSEFNICQNQNIVCAARMSISENGLSLIKEFEGFLQYAQWDYKQWSIGYGTGVDKNDYPDGITEEEADRLLRGVVINYEGYVNNFLSKYNIDVTQNQYDALVSLTYNMGNIWVDKSKVTIRDYLIDGISNHTEEEIKYAFGLWCMGGGQVLPGLVRRRAKEAELFLSDHDYREDTAQSEKWRITSATGVRLRAGTSTSSDILGVIPYKYEVKVTEKAENEGFLWGKTYYNGKSGWTVLDYAEHISGEITENKQPEIGSTEEKWRITSSDGVNMRLTPGLSGEKIGVILNNEVITVYETQESDGYLWGRTNYKNKAGWCVLNYAEKYNEVSEIKKGKLMGIRVQELPSKLVYTAGELFDNSGMVIVAVYSDGSEEAVTDYGCSGNTVTPGSSIITIGYQSVSCEFTVRVNSFSGDVNQNGIEDWIDFSEMKKYVLKNTEQIENADVNSDSKLNVFDLMRSKRNIINNEMEQRNK